MDTYIEFKDNSKTICSHGENGRDDYYHYGDDYVTP